MLTQTQVNTPPFLPTSYLNMREEGRGRGEGRLGGGEPHPDPPSSAPLPRQAATSRARGQAKPGDRAAQPPSPPATWQRPRGHLSSALGRRLVPRRAPPSASAFPARRGPLGRAPILLSGGGGRGGLAFHPPPPPPLSRAALLFGTHSAAAKGEPSQVIKSLVAQPCRSAAC